MSIHTYIPEFFLSFLYLYTNAYPPATTAVTAITAITPPTTPPIMAPLELEPDG